MKNEITLGKLINDWMIENHPDLHIFMSDDKYLNSTWYYKSRWIMASTSDVCYVNIVKLGDQDQNSCAFDPSDPDFFIKLDSAIKQIPFYLKGEI